MSLTAGQRLGPYEIVTAIGKGGMGEVFRAKDTRLARDVAIKVLPATFAQDPERLARFEREARVLASLNHTNIAHVYGFESATLGDGTKIHFLAMEMVEGQDLAEQLRNGPLPVDEAIAIAKQVADGLEEAHEHALIHRDLKPANVKVTPDGKVKILDFGLAKAYEGDPSSSSSGRVAELVEASHSPTLSRHMTEAGMILGTAAYMSPEQARGKTLDRRTDIWAFGVVLYEMLTGTRLFAGETVSDVLAAVLTRDPDWASLPAATPLAVRQLLTRCLDRDPKRRLRDIGEAALLLASPPATQPDPEPARIMRTDGRERAAWVLAVVSLLLAAGLAVRGRSAPATTGPLYFSLSTALSESTAEGVVISPDGMRVAFLGRLAGAARSTIFVRELRESLEKSLPGTEGVSSVPAFSPDGKWLVYVSDNRGLRKVAVDGGLPVDLARGNFRYATPAWLEGGRIVVTIFNWEQPGVLHELPESGGSPTPLPGRKELAAEAATHPRPLPGGRAVLVNTGRDQASLAVQSLETGERKVLAQNARHGRFVGGNIVWLDNDKLTAAPFDLSRLEFSGPPVAIQDGGLFKRGPVGGFDVSANGALVLRQQAPSSQPAGGAALLADEPPEPPRTLVWIDRSGKRNARPSTDPVRASEPRLSPDETRAVVDGSSGPSGSDVWTIDLKRGTVLRLSFTDGEDETGVWSPDGAWIAWAASRGGAGRALYRRRSDGSGKEEKLWDSGDLHCHAAAWTPDGRGILVTVDSPKTGFDVLLVTLDPKPEAAPLLNDPFNESSVRISPEGRWIGNPPNQLMRLPAAGGTPTAVGTLARHSATSFLPDGKTFVFSGRTATGTGGLYLGALDGRQPLLLKTGSSAEVCVLPSGWLVWLNGSKLVAGRLDVGEAALTGEPQTLAENVGGVSVSATGLIAYRSAANSERQLTWVDRSGAVRGALGEADESLITPRIAPDGRRVAVSREYQDNLDIWLLEGGRASRLTVDPSVDRYGFWSPDGKRLAFSSGRTGLTDLYLKSADGTGADEQLIASDSYVTASSWSPDGRYILYYTSGAETSLAQMGILPMSGDRKASLVLNKDFNERDGMFSPDGKWVAYQSEESGRPEIYVRAFVPPEKAGALPEFGSAVLVSTAGGVHPTWRADGKELYYLAPRSMMMAAPISVNGSVLSPGVPMQLFRTPILGGSSQSTPLGRQYDVSPDGRFLINTVVAPATTPITLVQNWNPEVKK